jgi:hypothetical protein
VVGTQDDSVGSKESVNLLNGCRLGCICASLKFGFNFMIGLFSFSTWRLNR